MNIHAIRLLGAAALCGVLLCGCGAQYKEGTYEAKSSPYEGNPAENEPAGDYGIVRITVQDGAVTDCAYEMYNADGSIKDENYGKENGEIADQDVYNMAQKSVGAGQECVKKFLQNGKTEDVDAISGATTACKQFTEAADLALAQAKK